MATTIRARASGSFNEQKGYRLRRHCDPCDNVLPNYHPCVRGEALQRDLRGGDEIALGERLCSANADGEGARCND